MASSSTKNTVHQNGFRFRKMNTNAFKFQWKNGPASAVKNSQNDEMLEQVRNCDVKTDPHSTPGRKPSGFFRNIKKRLCISKFMLHRSKQKIKAVETGNRTNEGTVITSFEAPLLLARTNSINQWSATIDQVVTSEDSKENVGNNEESNSKINNKVESFRNKDEYRNDESIQEHCSSIQRPSFNNLVMRYDNVMQPRSSNSRNVVEDSGENKAKASLTKELLKLSKYGWYWGPLSGDEVDAKLLNEPDGAFLVRDSSDDRYLLTLSFKSAGKLLHSRMEHSGGLFSLCNQSETEGFTSVAALIDHSMNFSQTAVFCYSRPKFPGSPSFPVRLTKPVSRFTEVRSLQYLCRFVIRQNTTLDNIHKLPLPKTIRGYIEEAHY
ncbi:suppressor of cytokine signaling 6 [Orussus abietinus]|uniref:suppressor of cytokine signaling 6 n=1 Tax=Orussus abietinus TaxID=222816 RepID=UPI000624FF79|nr:suppressor of cytokine signaling 6 [Orussus abietinus]